MISLREATEKVLDRADLAADEAEALFAGVLAGGADPVALGGFLTALRAKGECAAELTGAARAMRGAALAPVGDYSAAVDSCGTGGDGQGGFNTSTTAALLACAAGVKIAKHGNRSVSSKSGSADLLEALGMRIELPPAEAGKLYEQTGFTFLLAPVYHPAMKHAAPARKSLGFRTIFNLLGPLTNPAGVRRQLIGLYSPALLDRYAETVAALGTERTLVVHGEGYDEIIAHGATQAREVRNGATTAREITPEEAGVARIAAEPPGGDAKENAGRLHALFRGEADPAGAAVILNAAHLLVLAGATADARTGAIRAGGVIRSGAAKQKLEQICRVSWELA